jgi:2-(1,2-epoxy-1,2-dihydrophenyl)acetyl-CoA isomerase
MADMNGIEWNVDGQGVGRIVLNRPEHHNALGPQNAPALVRAIDEVIADQPRVIVIEARGPIFCAGGDIREFVKAGDRPMAA